MNLNYFLKTLIEQLNNENIKYCILRNYETLPYAMPQGDIDFLISENDIYKIQELISGIIGIKIIGVTKRKYVHNFFIYNIDKGGQSRALQVDFIFRYVYKGVSYLKTSNMFKDMHVYKEKLFNVPNKFDEVFITFFPFYISTGEINKKYRSEIIQIFQNNKSEFYNKLIELNFKNEFINNFYGDILTENKKQLKNHCKEVKRNIFCQNLNLSSITFYFLTELKLRLPFFNFNYILVNLNPVYKNEVTKRLDSCAKNIIYIEINKLLDYCKLIKVQTNFTLYVFYKKNEKFNIEHTIEQFESIINNR